MFLTGYHGTTLANARNILKEGRFKPSNSDTEWLGEGIYYYFSLADAYNWRDAEAILHSVIKIDDGEYLDFDSPEGADIYNQMLDYLAALEEKSVSKSSQKNQCAVMRMLWDAYPKVKVISASFPTAPRTVQTILDRRPQRKEFCVRDDSFIKCTHCIRRSGLDD